MNNLSVDLLRSTTFPPKPLSMTRRAPRSNRVWTVVYWSMKFLPTVRISVTTSVSPLRRFLKAHNPIGRWANFSDRPDVPSGSLSHCGSPSFKDSHARPMISRWVSGLVT